MDGGYTGALALFFYKSMWIYTYLEKFLKIMCKGFFKKWLFVKNKNVSNQAIISWNVLTHYYVRILVWLFIEVRYQWLEQDRKFTFLSHKNLRWSRGGGRFASWGHLGTRVPSVLFCIPLDGVLMDKVEFVCLAWALVPAQGRMRMWRENNFFLRIWPKNCVCYSQLYSIG